VHGNADALACELFAEAIAWALRAHGDDDVSLPGGAGEAPVSAAAWARARAELLLSAAGDERSLERVREALVEKSFLDFAELPRGEALSLATRLETFADGLLLPLRGERRLAERSWLRRVTWVAGVLMTLAVALFAVRTFRDWNTERRDLARRATWSTSSTSAWGTCSSPAQECAQLGYFFHTNQERDPWIVFNLGARRSIARVVVENRQDCCFERAVPLVVSVSDDQKTWREVARRAETFTTWEAKFARVRARYVRLQVKGGAMILHLSRVRILPS
jgi:hypothetical protein